MHFMCTSYGVLFYTSFSGYTYNKMFKFIALYTILSCFVIESECRNGHQQKHGSMHRQHHELASNQLNSFACSLCLDIAQVIQKIGSSKGLSDNLWRYLGKLCARNNVKKYHKVCVAVAKKQYPNLLQTLRTFDSASFCEKLRLCPSQAVNANRSNPRLGLCEACKPLVAYGRKKLMSQKQKSGLVSLQNFTKSACNSMWEMQNNCKAFAELEIPNFYDLIVDDTDGSVICEGKLKCKTFDRH